MPPHKHTLRMIHWSIPPGVTMTDAFVFAKIGQTDRSGVLEAITALDPVSEAHLVAGTYDLIAETHTDEVYDALQLVADAIADIDGVIDTKTYVAID